MVLMVREEARKDRQSGEKESSDTTPITEPIYEFLSSRSLWNLIKVHALDTEIYKLFSIS